MTIILRKPFQTITVKKQGGPLRILTGGQGPAGSISPTIAEDTIMGRISSGTGAFEQLTPAQVRTLLGFSSFAETLIDDANATAALATLGIEAGTWTPAVTFVTPGDVGVSYATQDGTYLKIGSWLIKSFNLIFTPTYTTASGAFCIGGFPFAVTNGPIGNFGFIAGGGSTVPTFPAGATSAVLNVNISAQQLRIVGNGSGVTSAFTHAEITSLVVRSIRGTIICAL